MAREDIRRSDDPRLVNSMKLVESILGGKVEYYHHNSQGYGLLMFTGPSGDSIGLAGSSGHGVTAEQAYHILEGIENVYLSGLLVQPRRELADEREEDLSS